MKTALQVFPPYFALYIKRRLAFPYEFLAGLSSNLVTTALGMLFIIFLVDGKSIPNIQGWSRYELLFIYSFSMIPLGIFGIFSENFHGFARRYIVNGDFDRILLRPVSCWCQVIFESFNIESLGVILAGCAALIYSAVALDLEWTFLGVLWFIISALSGAVILMATFTVLCAFSFFIKEQSEYHASCFHFLILSRYPLPIFGRTLQFALTWILPYGFISYYPATALLARNGDFPLCYATPIVALFSVIIAKRIWKIGLKHYDSSGN